MKKIVNLFYFLRRSATFLSFYDQLVTILKYADSVDDVPFTLSPFSGVSEPEPALIISLTTPPSPPCLRKR